jgi:predicted DNA-binding transcriptional regulator AlpA
MSEPEAPQAAQGEKLLTLTEVAKRLELSMPTLQRYKKAHQNRIPSQGEGRQQRYPESALAVFEEIRRESEGRRGRPRKAEEAAPAAARKSGRKGGAAKAKPAAKPAAKAAKAAKAKPAAATQPAAPTKPAKAARAAAAAPSPAPVAKAKPAKAEKGAKAAAKAQKPAAKAKPATKAKPADKAKPAAKAAKPAKGGKVAAKPAKAAAKGKAAGSKPAAKPAGGEGLLTLAAIGKLTGISAPTLQRYIKRFKDRIPVVGSGRSRRYPQAALEVFNQLRGESKRGPKAGAKLMRSAVKAAGRVASQVEAGVGKRIAALEKIAMNLQKQVESLVKDLRKPIKVNITRG